MLFRCIDFETSGFPPDAGICEVGWCDVIVEGLPWSKEEVQKVVKVGDWQSELTDPGRPIEIAAMAIHHITDSDVAGKRKAQEVLRELEADSPDYFVAHNAKFEREFFSTQIDWICTLKSAYRLCPNAPNHQNQTIRYFLKTPVNRADAIHTHRAGPDAYVTAHTLGKFLTAVPPDVQARWEKEPPVLPFCPIGKFRGKPWPDVEVGFLSWMLNKAPDMDPDLKWNARREMNRRFPQHADKFKNA